MTTYWLQLKLESDATFGRGDGVAGWVDVEVQHDVYGLPYLGGKTLKGLLVAAAAEVLHALAQAVPQQLARWERCAEYLFGRPGSGVQEIGQIHVSDARLPAGFCAAVAYAVDEEESLTREEVLNALTALRRQTAMDAVTGAPQQETLRTVRVILRETAFVSQLDVVPIPAGQPAPPTADLSAFLAACAKALRRAGTERNRGRGKVRVELFDHDPDTADTQPVTDTHFKHFSREVLGQ